MSMERDSSMPQDTLPAEAQDYYALGREASRLTRHSLEFLRTQAILTRYLPATPAVIYDVGGGPGAYALWLARLGYTVHLLDAAPLHIEQAQVASAAQSDAPLASCVVGDARRIACPDASVDAVLLLGPLYHLTERGERVAALREAYRILRPGGVLFAAAISRFASMLDGVVNHFFDDPQLMALAQDDLATGQHRNPSAMRNPSYFTTAYFHLPAELRDELLDAGFAHEATLGVEGPLWLNPTVEDDLADPTRRAYILATLALIEAEPDLLGASAHLLATGRKG